MVRKKQLAQTLVHQAKSEYAWRGRSYSLLHLNALATLISVLALSVSAVGQKSCPLTDSQTQKSIAAWEKIANFLINEPRCVNCHGKVNPYIDGVGLDPNDPFKDPEAPVSLIEHGGGIQRHENTGVMDQGCKKCHDNMAPKGKWVEIGDKPTPTPQGSALQNWTTAPNFLSFVDKDATTLCRQIKRATGTADGFMAHLKDDGGRANFAGTAFWGNRGLGDDSIEGYNIQLQPPSITHAALTKLGQDWINAMGGKFQGDEGCGCEIRHALWSGQIHYVKQVSGDEGDDPDQQWSNRSLTTVTVNIRNGHGTFHGHVDQKGFGKNWQPVFHAPHRLETSDDSEESGDGTAPATLEVSINETSGKYSIQVGGVITPDGKSTWPNKIGEAHWTQCTRTDCKSGQRDVAMPSIDLTGPFYGTTKDPNHIQASYYDKTENLGRSHKGVMIRLTTVDLWRSGSK